jgi:O-antigen ligase
MAASVALSLNRNGWIGVAFGLVLLLALGGGRLRRGVAVALVVGASVAAVALLVGMERQRDSPLTPLVARGETLLDPRAVARSDSLQSRFSESERAWTAFAQRPLTGIGAGTSFGVFFNEEVNGTYRRTGQLFLHNQYLYLLVIAGIPGLIAFVGFLAGVIARARWAASEHAMACLVGLAMIMLSAVVMISFANPNNAVVVALLTGALMALPRERAT